MIKLQFLLMLHTEFTAKRLQIGTNGTVLDLLMVWVKSMTNGYRFFHQELHLITQKLVISVLNS